MCTFKCEFYHGYEWIRQRTECDFGLVLFLEGEDIRNMYKEILMILSNNNNALYFQSTRDFFMPLRNCTDK